jgi:hypothetical protein
MENTQLGEWLQLSDAIGATGLTARSLQRYAKAGKVEREVRGYGEVFYLVPPELRKDRRDEAAVVSLLREQGEKQVETIDKAATALEVTTLALANQLSEARLDTRLAQRTTARLGLVAALLLATSVGLSVVAWRVSNELQNETATRRQMGDIASKIESELDRERALSTLLLEDLERQRSATTATALQRDQLVELVASIGEAQAGDCEDGDKSATSPTLPLKN